MAKEAAHTLDAFHRGRFWLVQPKQTGHRAGADALILAAAVPAAFCGRLADFGAGAGAAALAVAARCPGAEVQLVERSPEMADFARQTLEHPKNAGLSARASLLVADVGLAGAAREKAGLAAGSFDFVIMNPPFNGPADRSSPDELRRQAHVMDDGLFAAWLKSAAAVLRQRGSVAIIARPPAIASILAVMHGRFGAAEIVPVHARADAAAIRVVIRARLSSRAALSMMPPLVLHEASGNAFSARAEGIFAGEDALFGD